MRLRSLIFILCTVSLTSLGQVTNSTLSLGVNIMVPTYKDFVDQTSTGGRIGFNKLINPKFGFGFEGSYNALDGYVPRTTYDYPGGSITTDVFNYMYYFTLLVNGQYYFKDSGRFIPYASLGAGVAFAEYKLYYNVYSDSHSKTGFVARPEAGLLFRITEYSNFGLKSSVSFDYATVQDDYFNVENFSGVSFQIGIVLFND